jgi:hypothetical protein
MWEEYEKLPTQENKSYFAAVKSPDVAVSLWSLVQPDEASIKAKIIEKQTCSFVIDCRMQADLVPKRIVYLL